ncbi:MAG: hypothetical protein K6F48_03035 [Paludibacteraceae bacterium]|nr:hypothetical protein [Paludibacteraceae bacterium]
MLKRLFYFFPLFILIGCQDLMVSDISDSKVEIYAPQKGAALTSSNITFWWSNVEDASFYNIQVASPSFDEAQTLWHDSIVSSNKIRFALEPGLFEWRIKAINDISETKFTTASFRIDSTLDLSPQIIILYSPTDKSYTNKDSIKFTWSKLYNADSYTFTLENSEHQTICEKTVEEAYVTASFPEDGLYTWHIKGFNEKSNTEESSFSVFVDRTPPEKATLGAPANNETLTEDSVMFRWDRVADEGSEVLDNLIVAKDQNLSDVVLSIETDKHTHKDLLENGVYYWTVYGVDKAGNRSEKSAIFSFTKE